MKVRVSIRRAALICVIPYLILGILGGGPHNHAQALRTVLGSRHAQAGDPATCRVDVTGRTASSADCPACQWLLSSNSCGPNDAISTAAAVVSLLALPPAPAAVVSPWLNHQSRAPPSS